MTALQLREAVDSVVGQVPFEAPVSAAYCTMVRDTLRRDYLEKLDEQTYSMEVYHRNDELIVSVWLVPIDHQRRIHGQWSKHTFTYPFP